MCLSVCCFCVFQYCISIVKVQFKNLTKMLKCCRFYKKFDSAIDSLQVLLWNYCEINSVINLKYSYCNFTLKKFNSLLVLVQGDMSYSVPLRISFGFKTATRSVKGAATNEMHESVKLTRRTIRWAKRFFANIHQ